MADQNITPDMAFDDGAGKPPKRKISIWLVVGILLFLVIALNSLFLALGVGGFFIGGGPYTIEEVVLSNDLQNGKPVDVRSEFKPWEKIICTVSTSGSDGGIVGMRWYLGDELVYEETGKAFNHTVSSAIKSNRDAILPEGDYHVNIVILNDIQKTVSFTIKPYHPEISPPVSIPADHQSIERPWFDGSPFAFDEVWRIDGTDWKINEVKVILFEETDEDAVAVVVETQMTDLGSLDEAAAKERARPVALYALEKGYLDRARGLKLDGKSYPLNQYLFVNLINPTDIHSYRVQFTLDELK